MSKHVTEKTRPDLGWNRTPRGIYLPFEVIRSDAFRALSKIETDLLLFIYTRRKYPSRQKGKKRRSMDKIDWWNPINGHEITVPYIAIKEFFDQPEIMKTPAPTESTITRSIRKLMHVGFISLEHLGGGGKGDCSVYRIAHNWRVWRQGDGPCFTKAGMSREKGFCMPGSQVFNPSKNAKRN